MPKTKLNIQTFDCAKVHILFILRDLMLEEIERKE